MAGNNCVGQHRYFIADIAQVEKQGFIVVIALCTSCGDTITKRIQVTEAGQQIKLEKTKGNENVDLQKRSPEPL